VVSFYKLKIYLILMNKNVDTSDIIYIITNLICCNCY